LYSSAWLDLSKEPMVLSVPDTSGRYYLMPMLDAWTNVFASPGKRTTGTKRGVFAIVGPNWQGQLPKGVKEIRSPTDMAWLIGRIQTNGKQDYANVHRLQDQFRLVPLSAWRGQPPQQPVPRAAMIDTETPPAEQVAAMDAQVLHPSGALLPANPPAADDAAMVEKMQRMGIKAGEPFKTTVLEPSTARRAGRCHRRAGDDPANGRKSAAGSMGWRVQRDIGGMALTTAAAPWWRCSAWARICPRMRSTRPRAPMRRAVRSMAAAATSCISTRASCRR
jgi:hypothetical protein